jgi:hypothetical protein
MPEVSTFQGSIKGDSESWIAITTTADTVAGWLCYHQTTYSIEPLSRYTDNPELSSKFFISADKDLSRESYPSLPMQSIKVESEDMEGEELLGSSTSGTLQCRIVLACDLDFYLRLPTTWQTDMITVINGVDNIYAAYIDTALSVTGTIAFLSGLTATDPYQLLPDFRDAMISVDKSTYLPRDVAHLFSGKLLSVGGLAYEPGLRTYSAYGLSRHFDSLGLPYPLYTRQMIVAHEIGHNFYGRHSLGDIWYIWPLWYRSIMGPVDPPESEYPILPKFSDGTGYYGYNNCYYMQNYARSRLVDWSPKTIPSGKYYNFYTIDYDAVGGAAYHMDTTGSSQGGYTFFGYTSSQTYFVRPDGKLHFTGNFRQYDTFWPSLQAGRRMLFVYALSTDASQILGSKEILNYLNGTTWHYIEADIDGLTPGQEVRFAVGRPDSWTADWQLTAEWAGVTIFSEYSGRTSPTGRYYRLYGVSTTYGDGYHIDTTGSSQYSYRFYGYTGQTFTVSAGGNIRVNGRFRVDDSFSESQAPGRRMAWVYLLDQNGNYLQQIQILNYTDTDFTPKTAEFTDLSAGTYRIGIGRVDSWSYDWHLAVEWVEVSITTF